MDVRIPAWLGTKLVLLSTLLGLANCVPVPRANAYCFDSDGVQELSPGNGKLRLQHVEIPIAMLLYAVFLIGLPTWLPAG